MKYTLTVEFEAEDIGDAIESARNVIPVSMLSESLNAVQARGLIKFSLTGGGKELHVDLTGTAPLSLPTVPEGGSAYPTIPRNELWP